MISLAPLFYRSILVQDGGPIERVEVSQIPVRGRTRCIANATLRDGLVPRKHLQLYNTADGTGVHVRPMIARHMAISESLERWAYHATVRSPQREQFGFHVDESSNGMAAFPNVLAGPARRAATLEAVERFCVLHWWEGQLPGRLCATAWPGVSAVVIAGPADTVTVIAFARSECGFFSYGHSAASTFKLACERAVSELARHEAVLKAHRLMPPLQPPLVPAGVFERRSLFFAGEEGHALFIERVHATPRREARARTVADAELRGPWSRYAVVWRTVYAPPSDQFVGADERYFFW